MSPDASSRPFLLVRRPSPHLQDGELTHRERVVVDAELAAAQWAAYVDAFRDNGFGVVEVAAAPEHPDSVFIEDPLVVFGTTAVVANPVESRKGEAPGAASAAEAAGLTLRRLPSGRLEGGDVLTIGSTVYVGRGGRTDDAGIDQLEGIVTELGYRVIRVPVTRVLHLKSALTALPDGTVIGYESLVDDPGVFDRFVAMPEETGAAVVALSPDAVLMASSAPQSARVITQLGYRVVTVDISEFEKLEGCVTCLSVRVR